MPSISYKNITLCDKYITWQLALSSRFFTTQTYLSSFVQKNTILPVYLLKSNRKAPYREIRLKAEKSISAKGIPEERSHLFYTLKACRVRGIDDE